MPNGITKTLHSSKSENQMEVQNLFEGAAMHMLIYKHVAD
jgi:hypothetical protein